MNEKTRKELLETVKSNYSVIASDFARDRERPLWPELIRVIRETVPTEKEIRILDIGCGNGRLLKTLPPNVQYLGIDNSPELIAIARDANRNDARAEFMTGDILELNKNSRVNFDFVFAVAILHHLPSKKLRLEALKQMKSKLTPGGRLIITNWNLWADKKYSHLIWRFWLLKILGRNKMDFGDILFDWHGSKLPSRRYYHAFSKNELMRLARTAGLKIKKLYKDSLNYYLIAEK